MAAAAPVAGRLRLLVGPAAAAPHPSCRAKARPSAVPVHRRRRRICCSAAAERNNTSVSSSSAMSANRKVVVTLKLTYLEINGWVWQLLLQEERPLRILVDPIVVGNLDFGAPWLFDGAKKSPKVKALGVDDLLDMEPDLLLITQSLDDHCHVRTLTQLSARAPELPVVTTPNAAPVLASLPTPFRRVTYLEPGQSTTVNDRVGIVATAGPVLGPPWQRPENGYVIFLAPAAAGQGLHGLLYYEPHCVYNRSSLVPGKGDVRADVVITPVVKQLLPANFTLVSGQEDAVELARLLRARYVVPMNNGDVDAGGLLATVLYDVGTTESFKAMLAEALPEAQVVDPTPGVPLQLQLDVDVLQPRHQAAAAQS